MEGVRVAYFLVHMLGSGRDYARREVAAAEHFAKAAKAAGVERIVYLGGLGPDEGGSPHLDSRHHTAEALRRWGPPLTYFRAAMIIGPHSESYELLRSIAATAARPLPEPEWLRSRDPADRDPRRRRLPPRCPAGAGVGRARDPDRRARRDAAPRRDRPLLRGDRTPRRRCACRCPTGSPAPASSPPGPRPSPRARPRSPPSSASASATTRASRDPSGAELFDIEPEPLNVAIQRALAEQEAEGDG